MRSRSKVVIVGGGISGLATAWWLHKAGIDVLVLERENSVGGTMRTVRQNGWLIETGPNSALETTPLFQILFADLRLTEEVVYANDIANNRYILRDGTLHALPMTPGAFLKSRLWSVPGKLRLLKEPFAGRAHTEETVADFVERRLGKEFLDYAINPFVAGVYAGDPGQLRVQAAFPKLFALELKYGGLIKGQILGRRERQKRAEQSKDRARMFSFRNGIQTLPSALNKVLSSSIVTGARVQRLRKRVDKGRARYEVLGIRRGKKFRYPADAVVTAIPSFDTARFIAPLDRTLAESLDKIYYPPVAEVFLGFRSEDIRRPLDGFGFLVPAKERRAILGTIWSSSLFPNRSRDGFVALTTFVGGSRQPELVDNDDKQLVDIVVRELESIMGVSGRPVFSRVERWRRAIPQYNLGHLSMIQEIEQFEHRHPGLFLSGNFRGGIAVGDCIARSETVAGEVQKFLTKRMNQA
jgi:oxygen-dependent protoporphyrinogen oxidase